MTRLLEHYRNVAAAGFATPRQADSLRARRPPWRRATLRGPAGRLLLALAFDSTAAGIWVYRADGPAGTVYRIEPWSADQLTPAGQTLAPKK